MGSKDVALVMSLLEIKGLKYTVEGFMAVAGVDLTMSQGELLAIIGPNGAGKTTLFNLISGFLEPASGDIFFKGERITGLPPYKIVRKGICRAFQLVNIFHTMTVLENIRGEMRRQLLARNFDRREAVVALAAEAIRQMPGTDFILEISADDYAGFGNRLELDVVQRSERSPLNLKITGDPAITGGGVVVQAADGKRIWDNQLLSRLERFWPELRRLIAVRTALVGNNEPAGGAA